MITGQQLINGHWVQGEAGQYQAVNPATAAFIEPVMSYASKNQVHQAVAAAANEPWADRTQYAVLGYRVEGDTVHATVEVVSVDLERARAVLSTTCRVRVACGANTHSCVKSSAWVTRACANKGWPVAHATASPSRYKGATFRSASRSHDVLPSFHSTHSCQPLVVFR